MNLFNPDSWMDVFTILSVALIAGVPSWLAARTHRSVKTETKVIRDQLVNGHTTFLREDLDKALAAIEALGHDIQGLRADLHAERQARTSQVDDLRHDVDRMRRR